jgi:branched-chain amino acid transport system substrate-binding protein
MAKLASSAPPFTPLRSDKWSELSDALAKGNATNVEGASGPLDFNLEIGAPYGPYEIWQVADGGIRTVRQVNP